MRLLRHWIDDIVANDFDGRNQYIKSLWNKFNILTTEHFYHVGGSENNSNPMTETIVTNYKTTAFNNQTQQIARSV